MGLPNSVGIPVFQQSGASRKERVDMQRQRGASRRNRGRYEYESSGSGKDRDRERIGSQTGDQWDDTNERASRPENFEDDFDNRGSRLDSSP
ncbi:MAG: hypothetical protein HC801_00460 [Nitrospira sp.]|nr:hypothetical protein [Nitrospira sp.]